MPLHSVPLLQYTHRLAWSVLAASSAADAEVSTPWWVLLGLLVGAAVLGAGAMFLLLAARDRDDDQDDDVVDHGDDG